VSTIKKIRRTYFFAFIHFVLNRFAKKEYNVHNRFQTWECRRRDDGCRVTVSAMMSVRLTAKLAEAQHIGIRINIMYRYTRACVRGSENAISI